jgi:release factor glutamine methyltransferase
MQWTTNKLADLKKRYAEALYPYYDHAEANTFLNILIKSFFGYSRTDLAVNPDIRLTESEMLKLHFAIKDLKKYKPIQYIIKKIDFLNTRIMVNESVLIPRPETEELVDLILKKETSSNLRILDIGTGSGCIAIALKKNLKNASVFGVDISKAALNLASKNAFINEVLLHFLDFNILDPKPVPDFNSLDIIVSNPPYVTRAEKSEMKENVLRYEPHEALFVEDDPLLFYKAIHYFASDHLKTGGRIYLEINEKFGKEVALLFMRPHFKQCKIVKDIHGKDRFVFAVKI